MSSTRLRPLLAAVSATLLILIAGCCGSAGGAPEPGAQRIVSLSPSATETLFAIGAGERVVAVDDQSDFPPRAPTTELSSYQPNVEAIASYRPDLVIAPDTMPSDAIRGLRRLGFKLHVQPAPVDLAAAYRQMRELGALTGHLPEASRLSRRVRDRVEAAVDAAPDGERLAVFHELDPELFSASSQTFIGRIYARLGLRNIADAAARRAGTPYPQLSREAVIAADPELIVLADSECCGQSPAGARAGIRSPQCATVPWSRSPMTSPPAGDRGYRCSWSRSRRRCAG